MAKDKITKVTTPKAPKNKTTRVDNAEWKATSPLSGSGQSWSEWGKSNPNRGSRAAQGFRPQGSTGKDKVETSVPNLSSGSKKEKAEKQSTRNEEVTKWKTTRPVTGKGGAKSDEDKAAKRDSMIAWASRNPNRGSNAGRALSQQKPKKAAAKKAAAPKRGKKK